MPLGLRFRRRRNQTVGAVATAAFRVASQTSYTITEELPSDHSAASTEPGSIVSDAATPLDLVPPRDLWDGAYETLRETNSKILEQYEETIMRENQGYDHLAPVGSLARQEQLSAIVTRRLDTIEKEQKSFIVAGKTVVPHEQLNKFVRVVLFARNFVSQAVSAEPHAALAWAGVCVLLPLLLNPASQHDEAVQGFDFIPFIVHRYQVMERLRRLSASRVARKEADTQVLVADLENKVVQLYSKVLEYQIRLMRQFSHDWALRYGRDVFKIDEWKTMLCQMKDLDSICSQLAEDLGQEELEAGLKENNKKN